MFLHRVLITSPSTLLTQIFRQLKIGSILKYFIHFINIYFRQYNYIIKARVKANATCFDLKSHRQAKLRTVKFLQCGCAHLGSQAVYNFAVIRTAYN